MAAGLVTFFCLSSLEGVFMHISGIEREGDRQYSSLIEIAGPQIILH